jgi:hypothetical protein
MRKKIPTLLTLSAGFALLLSSPMLFFNVLLQTAQAANEPMTFKLNTGGFYNGNFGGGTCLTFEGHGTNATTRYQPMTGSFEVTNYSSSTEVCGPTLFSGNIYAGTYTPDLFGAGSVHLHSLITNGYRQGEYIEISISCNSSYDNSDPIIVHFLTTGNQHEYRPWAQDYVECILGGGSASTQATSSSGTGTTTTAQDSDGDGIPDSSDNCTHNSNHRCFKENASTQQPSSSSSSSSSSSDGTGNQTKG